ncbi:MAG: carbohydrate ABC transporter permease [Oscillospiraceae bacterium]|nr:carbohydrate ABC transporter permease [Oscillospiraceae bacterium]
MRIKSGEIAKITIAVIWSLLNLVPLAMVTMGSFKSTAEIYLGPFALPSRFSWENYDRAILRSNVLRGIFNSFSYAIVSVLIILALSLMTAYVLSRYKSRIIGIVYILFVLGILVPTQATYIPLVSTFGRYGLTNKAFTMIIIYVTFNLPLSIILITGYMKGINKEIDEAARIDGCGPFMTFVWIVAPLAVPAAATAGILSYINIYNDLIFANLFISKTELQTITQVINSFSAQYVTDMGATFAAVMIAILPMIIIYMLFQEKVIAGMSAGALKM